MATEDEMVGANNQKSKHKRRSRPEVGWGDNDFHLGYVEFEVPAGLPRRVQKDSWKLERGAADRGQTRGSALGMPSKYGWPLPWNGVD